MTWALITYDYDYVSVSSNGFPSLSQVAHSTCADGEYNLRSRTVVCGSCGQSPDKSHCSVTSASRSFRSGGISEGLLPHSYVVSSSTPRKVGQGVASISVSVVSFIDADFKLKNMNIVNYDGV